MQKIPANIYKLVYRADQLNDNVVTLDLLKEARTKGIHGVIHAMGEDGQISRVLGGIRGNSWSYVSLPKSEETAAGQLSLDIVREIYGLKDKNQRTRILGLLGYPLVQSRGWQLHNRLIQYAKHQSAQNTEIIQDFLYVNFPAKDFQDFWSAWRTHIDGLSITIPYKQKIVEKLDFAAPTVEKSGVCNTMIKRNKSWWGFNTDMLALYDLLSESNLAFTGPVLVYGTGATARSALTAIRELQVRDVYICGRNQSRGKQLEKDFNAGFLSEKDLKAIKPVVIIQTTPLGMVPKIDDLPPLTHHLTEAKLVLDVVHNPPLTRFLRKAQEVGCTIISGEQIFLRQAAYQFELFSGARLPLSVLEYIWKEKIEP
jgi:3-dehydroquinate dehydratase/shikimate dehydrogenase